MSSRNSIRSGTKTSFSSTVLEPEASMPSVTPPPQSGSTFTVSRGVMKLTSFAGSPFWAATRPPPMKWVAYGMPDE